MKVTKKNEHQLTVSVVLICQTIPQKVLLIYHKKQDCWQQPGGHIEKFEDPLAAAVREVREETGLDISSYLPSKVRIDGVASTLPRPDYIFEYLIPKRHNEPQHYHLDWLYVIKLPKPFPVKLEEKAALEIGWFDVNEALNLPMLNNTREILKRIITDK